MDKLWEILVPASNSKKPFSYEHHKKWDFYVENISGGLTVLKAGKGTWKSPTGEIHLDRVIPCRIICTENEIDQIIQFTIKHYEQEAVLAYEVSSNVKLVHKEEK